MDKNEEMDLETLQAQIDMSMSFAHDLVSSWIQPNKLSTTSRNHNLETELKEYMRRPPRLGVGAPIPETNVPSIETARLKGKLRDKGKTKRTKEVLRQSDSDDANESKPGIKKKRAKLDPFAVPSKPSKMSTNNTSVTVERTSEEGVNPIVHAGDRSRKQTVANPDNTPDSSIPRPGRSSEFTSNIRSNTIMTTSSEPPNCIDAAELLDTPACGKAPDAIVPNPNLHIIPALKYNVLNLDGPLTSGDEELKNTVLSSGTGRKKRRKRRKKKKNHMRLAD